VLGNWAKNEKLKKPDRTRRNPAQSDQFQRLFIQQFQYRDSNDAMVIDFRQVYRATNRPGAEISSKSQHPSSKEIPISKFQNQRG
jgi:hypothetical protein